MENIVRKAEISCYKLFLLFSQCFPQLYIFTIVETKDSSKRGINPVAMTIINPQKEYLQSQGSNKQPPVLKSAMLLSELWGSVYSSVSQQIISTHKKRTIPEIWAMKFAVTRHCDDTSPSRTQRKENLNSCI